jgi:hypothetical protein
MRAAFALLLIACGSTPIGRDATVTLDIEGGCAAAGIVRIDVRAYAPVGVQPIGGNLIAQAPCGESMRAWFALGDGAQRIGFWGISADERPTHIGIIRSEELRDGARVTLGRARE